MAADYGYKVTRTFHPIGQGAFYSECHEVNNSKFNVIYDCGVNPLTNYGKKLVADSFAGKTIDILFISHLDYDHVSCIAALKKSAAKINYVVLPLLEKEERHLLVNINRVVSRGILTLIDRPEKYFGANTKIIRVKPAGESPEDLPEEPSQDPPEPNPEGERETFSLDDAGKLRVKGLVHDGRQVMDIESNSEISFGHYYEWLFVTYNFRNEERSKRFRESLKSSGFDVDKLTGSVDYSIKSLTDTSSRKVLRKIYDQIDGTVNENSMLLYSGPAPNSGRNVLFSYDEHCVLDGKSKWMKNYWFPGCLYTGDCDFNTHIPEEFLRLYGGFIDTVQIPHHGSRSSYSVDKIVDVTGLIYRKRVKLRHVWRDVYYERHSRRRLKNRKVWALWDNWYWGVDAYPNPRNSYGRLRMCMPVSYGKKNGYGHPAMDMINELSMRGFTPILINESQNTCFKQIFNFEDLEYLEYKERAGIVYP